MTELRKYLNMDFFTWPIMWMISKGLKIHFYERSVITGHVKKTTYKCFQSQFSFRRRICELGFPGLGSDIDKRTLLLCSPWVRKSRKIIVFWSPFVDIWSQSWETYLGSSQIRRLKENWPQLPQRPQFYVSCRKLSISATGSEIPSETRLSLVGIHTERPNRSQFKSNQTLHVDVTR